MLGIAAGRPPTRLALAHPFSAFEPVCLRRFLGFVEVSGRDEVIAEGCSTPRHSRATNSRSPESARPGWCRSSSASRGLTSPTDRAARRPPSLHPPVPSRVKGGPRGACQSGSGSLGLGRADSRPYAPESARPSPIEGGRSQGHQEDPAEAAEPRAGVAADLSKPSKPADLLPPRCQAAAYQATHTIHCSYINPLGRGAYLVR